MKVEMRMPQMGESIAEATISKWLVKVGDKIEKDQIILEISTDKVDSEIPAPASGTITELLYNELDVVPVKEIIAYIETSAEALKEAQSQKSNRFYSPLVKAIAEKNNLDIAELEAIKGSGQGGRLTKEDVLAYIENKQDMHQVAHISNAEEFVQIQLTEVVESPSEGEGPLESLPLKPEPELKSPLEVPGIDWGTDDTVVVDMDHIRQAIAEHMHRSKQTSPHVYSILEIDMTNVSKWRAAHKATFEEREKFKLSITPFFLEAAVQGLIKFPYINSSVDGKKIILKRHINLGCAVALGTSGLIVPVIKRAEEKTFIGIARSLNDLANRARNKGLSPDDVAGGTFTVTNPGVFGTLIGTPIINQPQVAILCLGAIKKRPVVIDDMIGIREMCYVTLSYDHRIIDGALAGQFLAFLRDYLEGWDMGRTL